jgi:hypothetical protein
MWKPPDLALSWWRDRAASLVQDIEVDGGGDRDDNVVAVGKFDVAVSENCLRLCGDLRY